MMPVFLLVIGVLLALVALPMLAVGTKTVKGSFDEYEVPFRVIGAVLAVLAGLIVLVSMVYTQDPGEAILIRSPGGSVIRTDTDAGFGLTAPWNKTTKFDLRNQRIEMFSNKGGEGDDGAAISAPLKNGTNVGVSITVQLDIQADQECIENIYDEYRSQDRLWENVLKPNLRDQVRRETAKYDAFEVKQRRAELAGAIQSELVERWEPLCISVNNVDLGDLNLDEATEAGLTKVNERQLEAESARADLERAQLQAEITKTEAKAQTDADQIIRCGADVKVEVREVAGQDTEVAVVTPKTGAACEERLNQQVLLAKWIEALTVIGGKAGNTVVVPDSFSGILNIGGARVE